MVSVKNGSTANMPIARGIAPRIVANLSTRFIYRGREIIKCLSKSGRSLANRTCFPVCNCTLGVCQEIFHHLLHAPRTARHEIQMLPSFHVEQATVATAKHLSKDRYISDWFLQVVTCRVRELLKVCVCSLKR